MVIFNVSETWRNAHNRTFRGFDPDDDRIKVRANGNIPCMIDGNGNCMNTGDRRIYCHYNNYNTILTVTLIPHIADTNDNCSLKMKSRHNERFCAKFISTFGANLNGDLIMPQDDKVSISDLSKTFYSFT
jgi:hypothetical protein